MGTYLIITGILGGVDVEVIVHTVGFDGIQKIHDHQRVLNDWVLEAPDP